MADHNGSTDVSTTPLPEALDTNHHVSHVSHVQVAKDFDTDPHPDLLVGGTDPRIRIRIRTKMARIRNTATDIENFAVHKNVYIHKNFVFKSAFI